jgi:hypothetical protein
LERLLHAHNGFADLRWIISKDVKAYHEVIAEMLYDTLERQKAAVEVAGHKFADVEASFLKAANPASGWLIDFF